MGNDEDAYVAVLAPKDADVTDLLAQMDQHAEPQVIEGILQELVDEVVKVDRGDGWFDLVGIVGEVPTLIIRYQWWEKPRGWFYRVINPKLVKSDYAADHVWN